MCVTIKRFINTFEKAKCVVKQYQGGTDTTEECSMKSFRANSHKYFVLITLCVVKHQKRSNFCLLVAFLWNFAKWNDSFVEQALSFATVFCLSFVDNYKQTFIFFTLCCIISMFADRQYNFSNKYTPRHLPLSTHMWKFYFLVCKMWRFHLLRSFSAVIVCASSDQTRAAFLIIQITFLEQDLDGEGLMELNTSLIQTYIPSITLGTCLKFFRLLKPYMKVSNLSTPDPFSSPTIPASTPTTPSSCAQTPICPTLLFASPSVSSSSQQSDEEETEVEIQQLDIQHEEASDILEDLGSPISPPRSSLTSKSSNSAVDSDIVSPRNSRLTVTPAGSFSIKKVQFPPAAMKMVETGKLSIAGKSAVTGAVVTMMLKQSTSSW